MALDACEAASGDSNITFRYCVYASTGRLGPTTRPLPIPLLSQEPKPIKVRLARRHPVRRLRLVDTGLIRAHDVITLVENAFARGLLPIDIAIAPLDAGLVRAQDVIEDHRRAPTRCVPLDVLFV